ncbi:MAG: hypothetical protein Q4C88_04850 [Akkermansia sp.]|nr:hypothetical protein [Akkermansia sp.]
MKKQIIKYGAVALAAMLAFSSCCWHHHGVAGWHGGASGHYMAGHHGGAHGFHHGMGRRR